MTLCKTNPLVTGEAFHLQTRKLELSASSHEARLTGQAWIPKFWCVHIIWEGGLARFFNRNVGSGPENLAIRTLQPGYRDESSMNFSLRDGIVLLCPLYFLNIPFSYKSCQRYDRRKVISLCFVIFALFPEFRTRIRYQDLRPYLIS